jgi:hypothetical protein
MRYGSLPKNGSVQKQNNLRCKSRAGYISARIIQLGYIQQDVVVVQE